MKTIDKLQGLCHNGNVIAENNQFSSLSEKLHSQKEDDSTKNLRTRNENGNNKKNTTPSENRKPGNNLKPEFLDCYVFGVDLVCPS